MTRTRLRVKTALTSPAQRVWSYQPKGRPAPPGSGSAVGAERPDGHCWTELYTAMCQTAAQKTLEHTRKAS